MHSAEGMGHLDIETNSSWFKDIESAEAQLSQLRKKVIILTNAIYAPKCVPFLCLTTLTNQMN